jgi:flagellar biosynthetic protein FlhB
MSEQSGEKSFAPTEKRRKDAAGKGDVLRSREVATAVSVLVGAGWLILAGPWLFDGMADIARDAFTFDSRDLADPPPSGTLLRALQALLPPVLALGASVMVATVVSQLAFGDGRFIPGNLALKASRLNPVSGLQRMLGLQGWIELGKALAKLALLGAIAWYWGSANVSAILGLGQGELHGQLAAAWDAMVNLLLLLAAGLAIIAFADWPIQFVRRLSRLKMTAQEMRDEHRESEGSPEKKAAIRQRQRQLARGGVTGAVAKAQFVLTNPTHFSVALAYDPALADAPVVLAKGRGEKALAMRDLAREHGVPLLEYPALARSVYFTTRENQEIRAELYGAVASVLAFVFSLKRGEHHERPQVSVPIELRFDADGRPQQA